MNSPKSETTQLAAALRRIAELEEAAETQRWAQMLALRDADETARLAREEEAFIPWR